MATKLQELREERKKLIHDMRESLTAALRGADGVAQFADADAETRYNTMEKRYDEVAGEIESYEKGDKLRSRLEELDKLGELRGQDYDRKPAGGDEITEETRSLAFTAWAQSQMEIEPSERALEAAKRIGLNPRSKKLTIRLTDSGLADTRELWQEHRRQPRRVLRALSGSVIADGGALVPSSLLNNLEVAMLTHSGMLETADIIRTQGGEEMAWPGVDDTSNEGRILGEAETEAAILATGAGKQPAFSRRKWGAYVFTSDPVTVPTSLLEDAAAGGFNLPQILGSLLGERLARVINRKTTVGTGTNEPYGMVPAAAVGKTTAATTAITYDEIVDLEGSLEPSHEANASYMWHKLIETYLRKIVDLEGRPLWENGFREGRLQSFNGHDYTRNQNMDSTVTAANKTIAHGDFSKYKIRQVREIRLYRLEERFRTEDKDGFVAFARIDGNLLRVGADALCPIQILQQKLS